MVSIIVPVYNTHLFLPQCVNSILGQTYKDIEVILVNDASTDNSLDICRKFEARDPRVRVVNLDTNSGSEIARHQGFHESKGEYVMFVDSDDWLNGKDTLRLMYEKIVETGVDYVEMQFQRVMDSRGFIRLKSKSPVYGLIRQPELYNDYYISFFGKNILAVNLCGKLYRRSVLEKTNLKPGGVAMGEDLYANLMIFPHLNSIYIMDHIGYNYRFGGMTSRYNPKLLPDLKKMFVIKDQISQERGYKVAYDYLRIELKNVFRSEVCQMLVYISRDKSVIVPKIRKELSDPIYQEVQKVKDTPKFLDDPFVRAMANADAEAIYEYCLDMVNRQKWDRLKKKIIWFLLSRL